MSDVPILLFAMAPVGFQIQFRDQTIGPPTGYASSHQAMVFWPWGMTAHTVEHEIGHLMGMSHVFPWVDAHVNKPDHVGTGGIDVMSYDSAETDLEFSEDSLIQIRGYFES